MNFELFFLLLGASLCASDVCNVPAQANIDWDKESGTWYQTINTRDIIDENSGCLAYKDFTETKNGLRAVGKDTLNPQSPTDTWSANLGADGLYHIPSSAGSSYIKFLNHEAEGENLGSEVENEEDAEARDINTHPINMFTDYDNYLLTVECGANGVHYVFGHTRSPHPTAEDVLLIVNKLASYGHDWANVPLTFSGCNKMK